MSLDKWIKTDKDKKEKKPVKKKTQVSDKKTNGKSVKSIIASNKGLKKYGLNCSKKSCNYQKTIMKRILNDKDTTCPRCGGKLKVSEI